MAIRTRIATRSSGSSFLADEGEVCEYQPGDHIVTQVTRKHNEDLATRDNLVFALGVFLSQLAHERVFLIREQDVDVKIPSDLLGVTQITYVLKPGRTIDAAIAPVCLELRKAIAALGLR